MALGLRSRRPGTAPAARVVAAMLAAVLPHVVAAASPPAVRAGLGMVVAAEEHATRAGLEVLRDGGNAVDAAVAVAFTLAVTFPEAGNLGGGGFLLLRRADGTAHAIDFRETAPAAVRAADFLDATGRPVPERSRDGGLAVGVPGTVAGLAEAHRLWGKAPWRRLVAPAARLARRGFPLSRSAAEALAEAAGRLADDPEARRIFLPGGRPVGAGERLVQRDLAVVLDRIAARGTAGFYDGPVADALVAAVTAWGGKLDRADLVRYRPVARPPLAGTYRGRRIVTFPPPSSGGVALLQILGILERTDATRSGFGASDSVHLMAEAERRAFADRARWIGDPDAVAVPVDRLLAPDYLAALAAGIDRRRATPSNQVFAAETLGDRGTNTTHLSVADAGGDVVALTTTLNSSFGVARVAPGTGILLNNEMDDFALAPGVPNQFGLIGATANAVAGGRRPASSMCPVVVEDPDPAARPLLVLGSPGGPTIITSVLQVLVNVVDHGMELQEAVDAPRFHHQGLPDRIDHEALAFPADVARALEGMGHVLHPRRALGHVCAIGRAADGAWLGAVDPRRGGLAGGW